jgi:hypothetical protein
VRAAGVPSVAFAGCALRRPGKTGRQLADLEPIWQYTAPGGPREIYYPYQILPYFPTLITIMDFRGMNRWPAGLSAWVWDLRTSRAHWWP